ncbi:MAG: hypothetical protein K8L97_20345 [Anaerolineae bacterium]|nr:hypothetical protein [Anaerolineae bacterium]
MIAANLTNLTNFANHLRANPAIMANMAAADYNAIAANHHCHQNSKYCSGTPTLNRRNTFRR